MRLALALALALAACAHQTEVGSIVACSVDSDCAPPARICSPDGMCIPGCLDSPAQCAAGTTCDRVTGECAGAQTACSSDVDCDTPALVCRLATHTCTAGCDEAPSTCMGGSVCNLASGHCCDPLQPGCQNPMMTGCLDDNDCVSAPGQICQAGHCVAGCAQSGCTAPLTCGSLHRCVPSSCARDGDCDPASYCDAGGACRPLASGGAVGCPSSSKTVSTTCNKIATPTELSECIGAPGPALECGYCVQGGCYHPGLCKTSTDCHRGDACVGGLCKPAGAFCPSLVSAADVAAGKFAAGHEVCVRDRIMSGFVASDGDTVIKLGAPSLAAEITPVYASSGPALSVGETVTVHGAVRWNAWRTRWELRPVDGWMP